MNDVSHHEATMRILYGYVVRKNISLPGSNVYSWLRDHRYNHSATGGSCQIWVKLSYVYITAITLRKPGSNMRQKGSPQIRTQYQIWAHPCLDQSDPDVLLNSFILKSDQEWSWWILSIQKWKADPLTHKAQDQHMRQFASLLNIRTQYHLWAHPFCS